MADHDGQNGSMSTVAASLGEASGSSSSNNALHGVFSSYKDADSLSQMIQKRTQTTLKVMVGIMQRFNTMRRSGSLTDVRFKVGNRYHEAHRLVLSVSSEVFHAMLNNDNWSEHGSTEIPLVETEECQEVFEMFLDYFYTGELSVNLQNAVSLYTLANKYAVKDLIAKLKAYMGRWLELPSISNPVITWWQCSKLHDNYDLAHKCKGFILSNWKIAANSPSWCRLTKTEILELLQEDDILVDSEFEVYLSVERWLEYQAEMSSGLENIREDVEDTMNHVRITFIPPKQLLLLEQRPLVKQFTNIFHDIILMAYRFQVVPRLERPTDFMKDYKDDQLLRIYYRPEHLVEISKENLEIVFVSRASGAHTDRGRWHWNISVYHHRNYSKQGLSPTLTSNRAPTGRLRLAIIHKYVLLSQHVCKIAHISKVNIQGPFSTRFSVQPPSDINFTHHYEVSVAVVPDEV